MSDVLARVQDYLGNGGLFNPEMMDHDKVQQLIMDLAADLATVTKERDEATKERGELIRMRQQDERELTEARAEIQRLKAQATK